MEVTSDSPVTFPPPPPQRTRLCSPSGQGLLFSLSWLVFKGRAVSVALGGDDDGAARPLQRPPWGSRSPSQREIVLFSVFLPLGLARRHG